VATPPGTRTEIMELVSIFRGSVVDVSDETLTIAVTASRPHPSVQHAS
jgi:acetolactate synthase small subunit